MRVVHLSYSIPKPEFTDPEVWLRRINFSIGVLESMTKYGEILGIYHIHYGGILKRNGVEYHFPQFRRWQLVLPFQFNHYVKKLSPDVIIVHGLIFPWQVVMLRFQLGAQVKIIAQHHAEKPMGDIRQYFQMWADRYIKAYFFASHEQGRMWIERGQISSSKKIKEIMGNSSPFHPMPKEQARLITKVFADSVYIWVGDLDANKDPLTVAKAFLRFCKTNKSAKLLMIYQSDQLLNELKTVISNDQSGACIQLVGKIENSLLFHWYNSADFIISSSHYESGGIAVCEGLSCGCIPILTNIPSFRMMTDNGRIGFLFEAGNEDALLNALLKSQELDREKHRAQVFEQFNSELSFDANARKIMKVIHETD
jgi:glycosyltransferase involved in cell wall biosynthesis